MFAHDNPFRSVRVESLDYRPQGEAWHALMDRLRALDYRAAVVGPMGHGKTTLLETLRRALVAEGRRVISVRGVAGAETLRNIDGDTIVLLDSAEQLGWWAWRRFRHRMKAAGGLIIATHRPGRLQTLVEVQTSPELLGELISALGVESPESKRLTCLYHEAGGNLRDAFFRLYRESAVD